MKNIYFTSIERCLILSLCPISLFANPVIWEEVIKDKNEVYVDEEIKWEIINLVDSLSKL